MKIRKCMLGLLLTLGIMINHAEAEITTNPFVSVNLGVFDTFSPGSTQQLQRINHAPFPSMFTVAIGTTLFKNETWWTEAITEISYSQPLHYVLNDTERGKYVSKFNNFLLGFGYNLTPTWFIKADIGDSVVSQEFFNTRVSSIQPLIRIGIGAHVNKHVDITLINTYIEGASNNSLGSNETKRINDIGIAFRYYF